MRNRARTSGVDLSTTLGPVRLPNPIVAASGTFGHGAEIAALCDPRDIGAVTTKLLGETAVPDEVVIVIGPVVAPLGTVAVI